ncbi:MAG: HemK/PrmC family methyltransferase [Candidatus Falkowbacteria bacterium]
MLPKKNKKIKENKLTGLLKEAVYLFKQQKFTSPELEAQLLLAHVLKQDRLFVIAHPEYLISNLEVRQFNKLVKSRLSGWSSAVLLGVKEFYGLEFKVDQNVLVPRPETEILVDIITQRAKASPRALIMDIGTGSGAIINALFKNLKNSQHLFYASDKSAKALKIARVNTQNHQAKINFLKGDLLRPYLPILKNEINNEVIIAANLPYLKPSELEEPSIIREPRAALLSDADGLWHYQRLFLQIKQAKLTKLFLVCEINPDQALKIEKLAQTSFPESETYFKSDYSGQIRFFILSI